MNFRGVMPEPKPYAESFENLRTAEHVELKEATKAWSDCFSKNFLGQWMNGENINAEEVCAEQQSRMLELEEALYAEKIPFPFKRPYEV